MYQGALLSELFQENFIILYHPMKEKQPVYNYILYFIQYYVSYSIEPALKINVSKLIVFDVFYLLLISFIHFIFKVFSFYHQSID